LTSRIGGAVATFLNFYVSHGSVVRFLKSDKKCYIYFIDFCFQQWKNFRNG